MCGYMLIPSILLTCVSFDNVSRLEEAPSMSAGGDNFDAGGDTIESVIIFRIDGRTIKRGSLLDHSVM